MLRIQRNLTQEQMGEKLNISTSAYCKIEYGETDLTLQRLLKIADILKISPMELFGHLSGETCDTPGKELESLREAVKATGRTIEMLCKRLETIEQQLASS